MEYVPAAKTAELSDGQKIKVVIGSKEILLANVEGAFYAVDNKCTHMGGSLVEGKLERSSIICPKHGSGFDVRTGKLSQSGKLLFVAIKAKDLQTYPVKVEGPDILIGIG